MSTANKNVKFNLKVVTNKEKTKVLYAEANSDFADILVSFLTMPLGQIVRVLKKHYGNQPPVIGSLTTLYNGITNLDSVYFQMTENAKQVLLNPRSSLSDQCCKLKLDVSDNLYRSITDINGDMYLKTKDTKTMLLKPKLPYGHISKNQILPLNEESALFLYFHQGSLPKEVYLSPSYCHCTSVSFKSPKGPGDYVKGPTMFMVTDDLTVTPLCTTSSISIVNRLKIPLSGIKELELVIGLEEALSILKASLTSTCALTDGLINPTLNKQPKQEH